MLDTVRNSQTKNKAITILVFLFLGGCACPKDPGVDGGFWCTATNVSGGVYDQQIETRKSTLKQSKARGAKLDEDRERKSIAANTTRIQLNNLQQDVEDLNDELGDIEEKIKALKSKGNKDNVNKPEKEFKELKERVEKLGEESKVADACKIEKLQNELESLKKTKNNLLTLLSSM